MQTTTLKAEPRRTDDQSSHLSPGEPEPAEPISEKTRAVLEAIARLDKRMDEFQDVTLAVREIRQMLGVGDNWKSAFLRGLKQFISLVEPRK